MSKIKNYLNRVRDLRDDLFFPASLPVALWAALFNARDYDSANFYIEIIHCGKTLTRAKLPFNPTSANYLHRMIVGLPK